MSGQEEAARAERLAAALRANLARRKQQARGRKDPPEAAQAAVHEPAPTAPEPAGGGTPSPEAPSRPDGEG